MTLNKPKFYFILSAFLMVSLTIFIFPASSEERLYQAADFVKIGDKNILVVPNLAGIELIEVTEEDTLKKISELVPQTDAQTMSAFTRLEGDKYFAYVAAGNEIQKYDITHTDWPALSQKVLSQVGFVYDITGRPMGNTIITAGTSGVKELETENFTQVVSISPERSFGVDISPLGTLAAVNNSEALVFDRNYNLTTRDTISHDGDWTRKPYSEAQGNNVFTSGNDLLKKVGTDQHFDSWSGFGYNVSGIEHYPYIFWVNGWGIYKFKKDLDLIDFRSINKIGGWAVGVKAFLKDGVPRAVVLAGDRIYLVDEGLSILDVYKYESPTNVRALINEGRSVRVSKPVLNGSHKDSETRKDKLSVKSSEQPKEQFSNDITFVSPLLEVAQFSSNPSFTVRTSVPEAKAGDLITVYVTGAFPGEDVIIEFGPYPLLAPFSPAPREKPLPPDSRNQINKASADAHGNVVASNISVPKLDKYPQVVDIRIIGQNSNQSRSTSFRVLMPAPAEAPKKEEKKEKVTEKKREITRTIETRERREGDKIIREEVIKEVEKIIE